MIWQPFASASVFHEFAGNITSDYTSFTNGAVSRPQSRHVYTDDFYLASWDLWSVLLGSRRGRS